MMIETASSPGPFRNTQMSKAAQTHRLRKLRAPSKCRECDSLVVFHGAECEEVKLAFLTLFYSFGVFFFNEQNERNPIRAKTFSVQIFLVTPAHCIQTSRKSLPKLHNSFFITHGSKNLKQKLKEKKKMEKCHFYPP